LLHTFPIVEQLGAVMTAAETAKLLSSLIDSLPKDAYATITTAGIKLILTTVKSPLYTDATARVILLPTIAMKLRFHLGQRIDLPLCTQVLGCVMNFYHAMSINDDAKVLVTRPIPTQLPLNECSIFVDFQW